MARTVDPDLIGDGPGGRIDGGDLPGLGLRDPDRRAVGGDPVRRRPDVDRRRVTPIERHLDDLTQIGDRHPCCAGSYRNVLALAGKGYRVPLGLARLLIDHRQGRSRSAGDGNRAVVGRDADRHLGDRDRIAHLLRLDGPARVRGGRGPIGGGAGRPVVLPASAENQYRCHDHGRDEHAGAGDPAPTRAAASTSFPRLGRRRRRLPCGRLPFGLDLGDPGRAGMGGGRPGGDRERLGGSGLGFGSGSGPAFRLGSHHGFRLGLGGDLRGDRVLGRWGGRLAGLRGGLAGRDAALGRAQDLLPLDRRGGGAGEIAGGGIAVSRAPWRGPGRRPRRASRRFPRLPEAMAARPADGRRSWRRSPRDRRTAPSRRSPRT